MKTASEIIKSFPYLAERLYVIDSMADKSFSFSAEELTKKAIVAAQKEAIEKCAEIAVKCLWHNGWHADEEISTVNKQAILSLIDELK